MAQIFKPFAVTIVGVLLFLIWAWLSMSGLDYRPESPVFGMKTTGWFFLGIPMLIGMGLIATIPFSFLARKTQSAAGWITLLVGASIAIGYTFYVALPNPRLSQTLNIKLPNDTKIYRLLVNDSFNDGTHTFGAFSGSNDVTQMIADANGLSFGNASLLILNQYLDDEPLPEYADAYQNELMTCYFDPKTNTIYFYRRSSLPNP